MNQFLIPRNPPVKDSATENLLAWKLVQRIARHGEVTAAAISLDLDPGRASRMLKSLEKDIGFFIFDRGKRPLAPTPLGAQILNSLSHLLESEQYFRNLCREVQETAGITQMLFSIGTDADHGYLLDLLLEYRSIEPTLHISLEYGGELADLDSGRSQLVYLPYLAKHPKYLCVPVTTTFTLSAASPAYLAKYGAPEDPEALADHTVIFRSGKEYPKVTGLWKHQFYRPIHPKESLFLDNETALLAALRGEGIAIDIAPNRLLPYIRSGELVSTVNGWHRQCWQTSLVFTYEYLHRHPFLGNMIEWFAHRLRPFETRQWEELFKAAGEDFPIFAGESPHASEESKA